jgi:hypothetical protein
MRIVDSKIDEALAPMDLWASEQADLYNAAPDITTLPGGWKPATNVLEDLQWETNQIGELCSTILSWLTGHGHPRLEMGTLDTTFLATS